MAGEIFESYLPQIAIIAFKLSTMVGENFVCYLFQMARIDFKLSTMVGEKFESYLPQIGRINCLPFISWKSIFENCKILATSYLGRK